MSLSYLCHLEGHDDGETYWMTADCGNCGREFDIELTKGHGTPGYGDGPACSYCGCREWRNWRSRSSIATRLQRAAAEREGGTPWMAEVPDEPEETAFGFDLEEEPNDRAT